MKITLSFKTPDVLDDALISMSESDDGLLSDIIEEVEQLAEKYIQYGECLNVELDTDTGEATVIPV